MVGAMPDPSTAGEKERQLAEGAGRLMGLAGDNYTKGLRTYYFAIPVLCWFLHPLLFLAATVTVSVTIYWIDFIRRLTPRSGERHGRRSEPPPREAPRASREPNTERHACPMPAGRAASMRAGLVSEATLRRLHRLTATQESQVREDQRAIGNAPARMNTVSPTIRIHSMKRGSFPLR